MDFDLFQEKWDPLTRAARNGDLAAVEQCVKEGSDINLQNSEGDTPLHWAVSEARVQIVEYLVARPGIDINVKNKRGESPLYVAVDYSTRSGAGIVERLLSIPGIEIDARDATGQTPFSRAVERASRAIVDALLACGANADTVDDKGRTTLSHAASRGALDEGILELLLSRGLDANSPDAEGKTPLVHAAASDRLGAVRILIARRDVNLDARDKSGRNARDHAAFYRHAKVVELLDNPPSRAANWQSSQATLGASKAPVQVVASQPRTTSHTSPAPPSEHSLSRKHICQNFTAYVVQDFKGASRERRDLNLHEILYGDRLDQILDDRQKKAGPHGIEPLELDMWIHLPQCNLMWVEHVVQKLHSAGQTSTEDCDEAVRFIKSTVYEQHADKDADTVRYRKSCCERDFRGHSSKPRLAVAVPYLDCEDTAEYEAFQTELHSDIRAQEQIPCLATKAWDHVLQLAHAYPKTFYSSRTLDQSYYYTLRRMMYRDKDQVLQRYYKRYNSEGSRVQPRRVDPGDRGEQTADGRRPAQPHHAVGNGSQKASTRSKPLIAVPKNKWRASEGVRATVMGRDDDTAGGDPKVQYDPILIVNQLWLWVIGDTIITASPSRCSNSVGGVPTFLEHMRKDFGDRAFPSALNALIHLFVRSLSYVEEPSKAGLKDSIFDIFGVEIARLSDEVSQRIKHFQDATAQRSSSNPKMRNSTRDDSSKTDVVKEVDNLREIWDIRDELHMLRQVISDQEGIADRLVGLLRGRKELDSYENVARMQALNELEWRDNSCRDLLDRLDHDAHRVEDQIIRLLDLKQKQASLDEVAASSTQTQYLFTFTIVTVVFAPLSLTAAIFAVQVKQFPHDGDAVSFDSGQVVGGLAASLGCTILLILLLLYLLSSDFREGLKLSYARRLSILWPTNEALGYKRANFETDKDASSADLGANESSGSDEGHKRYVAAWRSRRKRLSEA